MGLNSSKLLSGRAQVVPYDELSADRYQFLALGQAEPSLGSGNVNNVLTLGADNARVWSDSISVSNISVDNVTSHTPDGNISITTTGNGLITIANISISNTTFNSITSNLIEFGGTEGVVIPSGNTAQRPSLPPVGALRLNLAIPQIEVWDGTTWIAGGGGGGSGNVSVTDQQITPDGSSASYSLIQETTQNSVLVSINGVGQLPGVAYTISGNSITFQETPLTTDIIDLRYLASPSTNNKILNSSGNTAVYTSDSTAIIFTVDSSNVATINSNRVINLSASHSLQLPVYTVSQASNLANVTTGQVVYVSNGDSGNPCLAVYSGGAFKRVSFGANISV